MEGKGGGRGVVWCCREDVGFKDLCYKDSSFLHGGLFFFAGLAWSSFSHFFRTMFASVSKIPGQERKNFSIPGMLRFSN